MLPFLLFSYTSSVVAAPVDSPNELSTFVRAETLHHPLISNNRSLWTIISTCLLTIFACIYTAIHPNVPSPYDGTITILIRAVGTMVMAVLAPELMVAWAARQYLSARDFTETMQRGLYRPHDETWTISHSFYAYMGGFMVYHEGKPWRTITPANLLKAIEDGNINLIRLTRNEINDTSKGNFISKGLVLLQVSWFCLQLIARHMTQLNITPLELATVGFCVPSMMMYILWWHKPLGVSCPRRLEWRSDRPPPDNLYVNRFVCTYCP
ncbi:hypothetical protein CONPUDRAFT_64509 [Coniophora puteana RWD-64-598 SS2]|uniref:Uncharacterized protein n=1 Tax=Coniophora puteana (strain RWD-64-598) TaxID=741705 RepID=A0A5M3MC25_CONPW|nr:uncharacterized protein CONPUDRAFT_64509 [Coniophora puteana RWD-64-598 SS2]EIW76454.1 hypothetical protein CONPUDRAFT_64509 [Coniophora puteana RWD-64-598 SS2]